MAQKQKKVLFVDDEAGLLEIIRQVMGHFAGAAWEIFTALDVSKALGLLQEHRIDLLVIDIHMPVVDGLQFLGLLQRKYPDLIKVVLTGDATENYRTKCLTMGAELFLEKPRDEGGWRSVHATLHELAKFQPEEGFRGVLRRVGLQDVLQMECLSRHSVVLKIQAGNIQGHVFVKDGQIIHAQCGQRTGEDAFNHLMSLAGGEFEVQSFIEPPERTITGAWEFLLMEAARKRDEAGQMPPPVGHTDSAFSANLPPPPSTTPDRLASSVLPVIEETPATILETPLVVTRTRGPETLRPQIEEMLVCSLQGEVLHEWRCANPNGRVGLLEFLSQMARQLAQGLPLGDFDRMEVNSPLTRMVAQIQDDRALFVRCGRVPMEGDAKSFGA